MRARATNSITSRATITQRTRAKEEDRKKRRRSDEFPARDSPKLFTRVANLPLSRIERERKRKGHVEPAILD